jgi:PKD repeat protein
MTGGTPSSSSVRNPTVSYAATGIKTISFTSTNAGGSSSPYIKKVLISAAAATACSIPGGDNGSPAGIKSFSLNNISKATGSATADGNRYMDFSCSDATSLSPSTTYNADVNVGDGGTSTFNHVRFYIDYNNNGSFADAGELAYTSGGSAYIGTITFSFTTPASVMTDQFLRARLIAADFPTAASPCHNPSAGQVEDYSVFFASSILLSISRLDFDGYHRNGGNVLNWETFDEKNNDYFEIERSTDGSAFDPIGRVNGVLNSNTSSNKYSFTDPLAGVADKDRLYYRLKIVDVFGRIEYSKIIVITNKTDKKELILSLQPNPFTNAVTATIQLREANTINMQLIDMTGRTLYRDQRSLPAGIHTFTYNGFENLPKGMYVIKLTSNTETASRLVEKQ